jgi:ABC-2 type transport system ATP-binding protein
MPVIKARDLVKSFWVDEKQPGWGGFVRRLIAPKRREHRAVDGVSFDIEPGEIVGYLGPNGAGKSTTIKMLTGILYPSSGSLEVVGFSPQRDRMKVVRQIGVVFGQRSQLYWDLRLGESFNLLKHLYEIDDRTYRENLEWAYESLGVKRLIDKPVRQLSLGERMRGDLVAAILHSPAVLFFDEPTIGLDIEGKDAVREMIRQINMDRKTTVILTTHDLDDVEELCQRLIVINHGRIVQDGPLDDLVARFAPYRTLVVECDSLGQEISHPMVEVVKVEGRRTHLQFDRNQISAAALIADLTSRYAIKDLSVREADVETLIKCIYAQGKPGSEESELFVSSSGR